MNLSDETGTVVFVIGVITTIGLFFVLRELFCWYWKINEIRNLLQKILERLPEQTKNITDNKILEQAASNEPVRMKRAYIESKKAKNRLSDGGYIEGMVACKACGKMRKPGGRCPHCGSF